MGVSSEGVFQLTPPSFSRERILGEIGEPHQIVFEQSATQQFALGTLLDLPDGRKFRYAKNGAVALGKSLMTQAATNVANINAQTQATNGTGAAVGDQEIIVDVTNASGITADSLAEGSLVVDTGTAIGDFYKILSCELLTTTTARLLLETPIRTAWAANTVISLFPNKWAGVIVLGTTMTGPPAGVPLIAVTAGYYCWLQTAGDCPMIVDTGDTLVIGNNCGKPGTHAVAGAVGVQTAGTLPIYGHVRYISVADRTALIWLTLE